MGCLTINGENYTKLGNLTIGKYEYILLIKGNSVYYVVFEDDTYKLPNPDLTLKGNSDVPLSNLNSRIMIDHIKDVIENDIKIGLIKNNESLANVLEKIQKILYSSEMYPLLKGGINQIYHFDEEVERMKDLFDELHNDITGLIPREEIKKEKKKHLIAKVSNDAANVDAVMLVMIANIGLLMLILTLLMILN